MKTSLTGMLLLAGWLILCNGCKKENVTATDPFKNTIWTGEFEYTSRGINEPYSITFDDKGSFVWRELNGDYPGTYQLANKSKTVSLTFSSGSVVTANINGNELAGFTSAASIGWTMKSGKLNTTTEQFLAGTVWRMPAGAFEITFYTETKFPPGYFFSNLVRRQGTIQFDYAPYNIRYFLMLEGNRMKGVVRGTGGSFLDFELVKQ